MWDSRKIPATFPSRLILGEWKKDRREVRPELGLERRRGGREKKGENGEMRENQRQSRRR